jgi:hypothetical protein
MSVLDNARHELFAQHMAAGKPISEAYVLAGFKESSGNASVLARKQHVAERVKEIAGFAAKAAEITKERVLSEIASIAFADAPPPPVKLSDKLAALTNLAKHLGLTNERLQVDVSVSLADLVNQSYKLEAPKIIDAEPITNITNEQEKPSNINEAG